MLCFKAALGADCHKKCILSAFTYLCSLYIVETGTFLTCRAYALLFVALDGTNTFLDKTCYCEMSGKSISVK